MNIYTPSDLHVYLPQEGEFPHLYPIMRTALKVFPKGGGVPSSGDLEKNKMDPEKNVVASLALHAVLEPVFKEVSR